MNEQDDNGQGFRIKDRRRFDADGRERLAEADVDDGSQPADATPSPSDIGADRTGEIPVDFSTFILSLSTSALIHLGESTTPEGTVEKNLQLARQVIDMLAMLQNKTKGNLTRDEEKLLDQLLYDLRLRFVQATP